MRSSNFGHSPLDSRFVHRLIQKVFVVDVAVPLIDIVFDVLRQVLFHILLVRLVERWDRGQLIDRGPLF